MIHLYVSKNLGRKITKLSDAKRLDRERGDLPERWVYRWTYIYFWSGSDQCLIEGEADTVERVLFLVGHRVNEFI